MAYCAIYAHCRGWITSSNYRKRLRLQARVRKLIIVLIWLRFISLPRLRSY